MRTTSGVGPGVGFLGIFLSFGLSGLLIGCGDNSEPAPEPRDLACAPTPPALPAAGPLIDPFAAPLEGCVEGGLQNLPGRWFVSAGGAGFAYEYPKFEGSCEAGFRRSFVTDDTDASDGKSTHTWSDGTRIFVRSYRRFDIPNVGTFEFANALTACMRPDGTLVAHQANFDPDRGLRGTSMTGRRFAPRDVAMSGLTLLGELGLQSNGKPMPVYNLVIEGGLAYTAGPLGFDVVDVSNPAAPRHLGHVDGAFNDVRVVRGGGKVVAYAAPLYDAETAIIDATDPAHPVLASVIPEYSHSVQVQTTIGGSSYLYLANYTNAVPVFDVTDPLTPMSLGQAVIPGPEAGVHDLTVDGDKLYVNYTTEGFVALDVSAGLEAAEEIGRRRSPYSHASWSGFAGGRKILLHGDEGMTGIGGAFLSVLDGDTASPTFMQEIGRYQSRPEVGIHNIQLVGDKVYLSYYQDGVRIIDLSTPTSPREVAHFNTWREESAYGGPFEGAIGIRVVGGRIYVGDMQRGLLILTE